MTLLYLVLVCVAGVALLRWLLPAPWERAAHTTLVVGMGAGIGIGIASSAYFICMAAVGPQRLVIAAVEGVILAAALALGILAKQREPAFDWAAGPPTPWYLTGIFGLAVALAAAMFIVYSLTKPHGEWDAWSIWNLHARFLYRGGNFWTDGFSPDIPWSHPEYPLLIPGATALLWTLAHAEGPLTPVAIGFVFAFAGAAVLVGAFVIFNTFNITVAQRMRDG